MNANPEYPEAFWRVQAEVNAAAPARNVLRLSTYFHDRWMRRSSLPAILKRLSIHVNVLHSVQDCPEPSPLIEPTIRRQFRAPEFSPSIDYEKV
jgi:hypothetical protein